MSAPFLNRMRKQFPFPDHQWEEYATYYQRIEVPAKTVLLREGDVSKRAYLIEQGCLRAWFESDGKDITFQFFFEQQAVSSAESFRKQVPSIFTIETIEPSVLYWISKENMDKIFTAITQTPELSAKMLEIMFERQLNYANHFLSFIKYNPQERYRRLMEERPEVLRRIPQQYIASYLGITPVSLSRIRSKIK